MVDVDAIRAGYTFAAPALELGALVVDDKSDPQAPIRIPLSLLNRHGLVFLAEFKGDVSAMAAPGESTDKIVSRMEGMRPSLAATARASASHGPIFL